eukprot:SAG31_NODE_2200_length_6208_cov_2.781306_2_plen_54_part_00
MCRLHAIDNNSVLVLPPVLNVVDVVYMGLMLLSMRTVKLIHKFYVRISYRKCA